MTDVKELQALLERVEKAEGPDRLIDRDIGFALDGWTLEQLKVPIPPPEKFIRIHGMNGTGDFYCPDDPGATYTEFTASIDAAVALVEKVLPGWGWMTSSSASTHLISPDFEPAAEEWLEPKGTTYHADAPTPALALCAALLRALIAKETT